MAIAAFSEDMDIIAKLSDTPNEELSSAELKAKFDEGGNKLKEYINTVLVPAINALSE